MPGLEVIYEKYFAPHAQDGPNSSDIDAQVTEVDTFQSYGPELVERRMRIPEEPIQLGRLENTTLINQSTWKRERYNI